jgi:hypothetical protein
MINPRAATPSICLFIDLNDGFTASGAGYEQQRRNAEYNNFQESSYGLLSSVNRMTK